MEQTRKTYSEKLKDPRWQKKRLEILNRDSFTCKWCCDSTSTLHVHHLKYSGDPWDVENEFLITLCESCHEQIGNGLIEAGNKLLTALKEKAFAPEQILKLAVAIENGNRRGIPYEPTTDIIALIFSNDDVYGLAEEILFKELQEKYKDKFKVVS